MEDFDLPYDHIALRTPYRGSIFVIEAVAGVGVVYNQLDEHRLEGVAALLQ
jgi:hypothetical protein